jgi:hypothetical protein
MNKASVALEIRLAVALKKWQIGKIKFLLKKPRI